MAKKKNYLLKFAKEMDWLGKYTFENQTGLNKTIDEATKLTDDEKRVARKAVEDILAARLVFDKIWSDYGRAWPKIDWIP